MGIKQKLAMGIATGALAVSMIGGGTYAYFSSTATAESTFKAGTLKLSMNPSEIINIGDLKPGDYMDRRFTLVNDGSLGISEVLLSTVIDTQIGDHDLANHIMVKFMQNLDVNGGAYEDNVIYEKTLAQLLTEKPDLVDKLVSGPGLEDGGLGVGDSDDLLVRFEFIDTGENNQNHLQGAGLKLNWTFTAKQFVGFEAK